ncbi:uncharacterized protein LOC143019124 [Oratosquilla oratoria]|uniref:uncharacterized protein LOC143019124 n=1 Tax=Oratosquilla oratoria TaxID=337810 RepID=UPI003F7748B5
MQLQSLIFLLMLHQRRTNADEEYGKALTIEDILPDNPRDYDKMRPPKKDNKPTAVWFHITVMGIDSIDESSMISDGSDQITLYSENMVNSFKLRSSSQGSQFTETYAADIFFSQSWKDHRLKLPENMTTEYRLLDKDWLQHLWRPDSFFKNAKQVLFQTMTIPNHYVWLYQSKTILYMVK